MRALLSLPDDVLRQAAWITASHDSRRALPRLAYCTIAFGLVYGAAMGTFRGLVGRSEWEQQILFSAVKVPILLFVTFAISLPNFLVLNSLFGLRKDFGRAIRALIAAQAGLAVVLASLAPFTLLSYASSFNYQQALLVNGVMFAVASFTAQWLVRGYYRPLIANNRRHALMLWTWMAVYTSVAIQLAWIMRPFIGSPGAPVQFFREDAWDNAYVFVIHLVWRTLFS